MVHGGVSPSTLAFDVEHESYSWMNYLARAGFDVFAMDMTGYGKSARPKMDDPCNVGASLQKTLIPNTLKEACKPSYPYQLVNRQSEHDDLDRVIEYIRKLRGVAKVNLLGWSGGGYRTGTYTSERPEKVDKLVIFASSNYSRKNPSKRRDRTAGRLAGHDSEPRTGREAALVFLRQVFGPDRTGHGRSHLGVEQNPRPVRHDLGARGDAGADAHLLGLECRGSQARQRADLGDAWRVRRLESHRTKNFTKISAPTIKSLSASLAVRIFSCGRRIMARSTKHRGSG